MWQGFKLSGSGKQFGRNLRSLGAMLIDSFGRQGFQKVIKTLYLCLSILQSRQLQLCRLNGLNCQLCELLRHRLSQPLKLSSEAGKIIATGLNAKVTYTWNRENTLFQQQLLTLPLNALPIQIQ